MTLVELPQIATAETSAAPAAPDAVSAPGRRPVTESLPSCDIDGTTVHLVDARQAQAIIASGAARHDERPLAVASINLDHVHHFGASRRAKRPESGAAGARGVEWLNLIDGAPIASQAARLTGKIYPKLSGSDLIGPVLDDAALRGQSVGVLGGSPEVTDALRARFAADWPTVPFAGHWTPGRDELASAEASAALAADIRSAGVDILLVCLGKPRQEAWIDAYGAATGAGVMLAFGAVVDFLAGRVSRAPSWISRVGLEWAWRLMLEPRRLARRYLIQGPPAYRAVRRSVA